MQHIPSIRDFNSFFSTLNTNRIFLPYLKEHMRKKFCSIKVTVKPLSSYHKLLLVVHLGRPADYPDGLLVVAHEDFNIVT
jgi:hypothetical protein